MNSKSHLQLEVQHVRAVRGHTQLAWYLLNRTSQVSSKILGIGSAERRWGDVKHIKTNKRSRLSGDRVKKQATIFGSYCMEKADIRRAFKPDENTKNPFEMWNDDDFDRRFDLFAADATEARDSKPSRIFKNWEEDWEEVAVYKKCPINQAKLLAKYGGLSWYDLDNDQMVFSDGGQLNWTKVTRGKRGEGRNGGYAVIAYDEHYDKDKEDHEDHYEPWTFSDDLRGSIAEYYEQHPELGVKVLSLEDNKSSSDDSENDDSDDDVDEEAQKKDESKFH